MNKQTRKMVWGILCFLVGFVLFLMIEVPKEKTISYFISMAVITAIEYYGLSRAYRAANEDDVTPVFSELKQTGVDLISLENERQAWAKIVFPKRTQHGSFLKLISEVEEIRQCIDEDIRKPDEYADAMFLLFDVAALERTPITPIEILEAAHAKLEINKRREWKDNGDGSYSHVK